MPLDLSKIAAPSNVDTLLKPREIFASLPAKDAKYKYLRDVQAEVLDQWHTRRNSQDLRLKMNTGSGKTLVGLLILKSCLNEGKRPAVYVAPTPYLASQVIQEAEALGLPVDRDPRSSAVGRGKAILVTHVHVLLNGKTKFGVDREEISIGSLLLDDAHACLATAEQQFTLELAAPHPLYAELLELFRRDLQDQSSVGLLDVEQQDPTRLMLVPFWAWLDKIRDVESALYRHREEDQLKFTWPLLRGYMRQCRCVIGAGRVEISPRCLPVEAIPSFVRAKRRIFMSATFSDDSILVTDFNANPDDIADAIAPASASDIGDRMILVPQELDPAITDEDIRQLAREKAQRHNVVVIVPSGWRADFWNEVASLRLTADNLEAGIEQLKQRRLGLVVVVNKYDGIDLPYDACRILILDGVPDVRRSIDQIEQSHLHGTALQVGRVMQMVEQGMGRGVRASDDHCVVLLMGRNLTSHLFMRDGVSRFTPATRAQFELSEQIGDQIRNKGIGEIGGAIDLVLTRNPDWVKAAKAALVHVEYSTESSEVRIAVARRQAFAASVAGNYPEATACIQTEVNAIANDPVTKAWLMAELAEYTHPTNPVQAQQIQQSAHALNRQLLRPQTGITYQRLASLSAAQATTCLAYIRQQFQSANDLVIAANGIADDLQFRPKSYKKFHRAMRDAALCLGFDAQLPESEYGFGPDVLWCVGALRYLVIECKNEAVTDTINKHDCNQLAGSMNWFGARYDPTCNAAPVMVHPSPKFEHAATPPPGTRVVTVDDLEHFRNALVAFCVGVSQLDGFGTAKDVASLLQTYHLVSDSLLATYSSPSK